MKSEGKGMSLHNKILLALVLGAAAGRQVNLFKRGPIIPPPLAGF